MRGAMAFDVEEHKTQDFSLGSPEGDPCFEGKNFVCFGVEDRIAQVSILGGPVGEPAAASGSRTLVRFVLRAAESCRHGYLETEFVEDPACCGSAAEWVELPHLARD